MANYKPSAVVVPSKPVAKRSPILGYNHNVRYRGLVFHVQTEDSGVLSPHLFTHLFHGGVIVSTRKLVYDAGASPEAIKALMQAQHKAVLKDLNKGAFDQKIDHYLAGTPGLEPRNPALAPAPEASPEPRADAAVPVAIEEGNDTQVRRRLPRDTIDDPMIAARLESGPTPDAPPHSRGVTAQFSDPAKSPKKDGAGVIELTKVRVPGPSQPPLNERAVPAAAVVPKAPQPPAAAAGSAETRRTGPVRPRNDSDPAQIYSPPPPAVEPPPGPRVHVTGQYSGRSTGRGASVDELRKQAAKSQSSTDLSSSTIRGIEPLSKTASRSIPPVTAPAATPPLAVPRTATLPSRSPLAKPVGNQPPAKSPAGAPHQSVAAPATAGSGHQRTGGAAATPAPGSSVVMTRPAVIVGAPAAAGRKAPEPPASLSPVQGLISERSLDEVIHAYLSEDGDDS